MPPPVQIVDNLFSSAAFRQIEHFVRHGARHSGGYDEVFVRNFTTASSALVEAHDALVPLACELFDEKVKPSYSYISNYHEGGRCPLHADRQMCRWTIDLLVANDTGNDWPLMVADPWTDEEWAAYGFPLYDARPGDYELSDLPEVSWNEATLEPNSAACYSGTHSWHYRPSESSGRVDLIFFHCVPEAYDGPLV